MRNDFPDRKDLWVGHETMYQPINLQTNGGLKREVTAFTRISPHYSISPTPSWRAPTPLHGHISFWGQAEALDRPIPGTRKSFDRAHPRDSQASASHTGLGSRRKLAARKQVSLDAGIDFSFADSH